MKKKKIKIIIIVIISVVAVLTAACAALYGFVIKPYSGKIINAVDQLLEDEEFMAELTDGEIVPPDAQDEISANSPDSPSEQKKDEPQSKDGKNSSSEPADSSKQPQQYEHKPKKDKSEYNSSYDYVKDNVSPEDLKQGMSLASKADVSYILGLLKGGLTSAEKKELKAYLKSRYTSGEISSGISLYNKYSYLLK